MRIPEDELIERLRHSYKAFNRDDFDAAVEFAHADIVFVPPGGQSEIRRAAALREWMEPDAFESQTIDPGEFEVAGNKVLTRRHSTARGAGSGIEMEIDTWSVSTFHEDGKVTRIESYLGHEEDEARRTLGGD
jgi:ketosteroid isomerase-like protein